MRVDNYGLVFCARNKESVAHLAVIRELWSLLLCLFGGSRVMSCILELLFCWKGCFGRRKKKKKQWRATESCSFVFNVVSLERKKFSLL
jgi:hypothetical protein